MCLTFRRKHSWCRCSAACMLWYIYVLVVHSGVLQWFDTLRGDSVPCWIVPHKYVVADQELEPHLCAHVSGTVAETLLFDIRHSTQGMRRNRRLNFIRQISALFPMMRSLALPLSLCSAPRVRQSFMTSARVVMAAPTLCTGLCGCCPRQRSRCRPRTSRTSTRVDQRGGVAEDRAGRRSVGCRECTSNASSAGGAPLGKRAKHGSLRVMAAVTSRRRA